MGPPFCPGRVLVRSNYGAVHKVDRPVEPAVYVRPPVQGGEDLLPDVGLLPVAKPAVDGAPQTESLGQVAPRGAGAQDPENAFEHGPVVLGGPAGAGVLRRQQRTKALPLRVAQFTPLHAGDSTP